MNHFISGILKITLLEASIALLVIDRLVGEHHPRARRIASWTLAGLMLFAWSNYGVLRGGVSFWFLASIVPTILFAAWIARAAFGDRTTERTRALQETLAQWARTLRLPAPALAALLIGGVGVGWAYVSSQARGAPLVHAHEQFHFYLAAKYQREVGWFDLYRAALIADRESAHVLDGATHLRDNTTFELEPVESVLAQADRIRARFSPETFEAFKRDWVAFTRLGGADWTGVVRDHGNSNSPAWSLVAAPLAHAISLTPEHQSFLGWLDLALMLVLFTLLPHCFGWRAAAVGVVVWAGVPFVFDYLAGSFLRWDWLFALGIAACLMQRERWGAAGAFFGYAVATKLFPILFGVALALRAALTYRQTRVVRPEHRRFALGTAASGAAIVVLAAAVFGADAWPEYARRIQTAQVEKFYSNQYSLKTVYLQLAESSSSELATSWYRPAEMKQGRADVDSSQHAFGLLLVRVAFTLLVFVLLRRATDVEAFLLGPFLVFAWLTVNAYYWNMLGLAAVGLATRKDTPALVWLIGVHAAFMNLYLYQHLNAGFAEGYVTALLLAGATAVAALWELWRARAQAAGDVSASTQST